MINKSEERANEGSSKKSRNASAAVGTHKTFTEPILGEYFNPAILSVGDFSEQRLNLINTIEIFLESQVGDIIAEIVNFCRKGIVDISKLRALGAICKAPVAQIELNLKQIIPVYQKAYIFATQANDLLDFDAGKPLHCDPIHTHT